MTAAATATVIAAVIAAGAAVLSAWYAQRAARATRQDAAEGLALKFREPLLQAAFNLQTRLFNIARKDFLHRFADSNRPGDRSYTVDNTLYVIGQYFCWVEIIRRESQFLDPRSQENERQVADQMERIREAFANSNTPYSTQLRVFRGQQRAVGELMLEAITDPQPGWPRWDCMGYASFVERLPAEPLALWFAPLRADLEAMTLDPSVGLERLRLLQHELLTLAELLDPEERRTSGRLRERL